jgi:ribosomal protein S6
MDQVNKDKKNYELSFLLKNAGEADAVLGILSQYEAEVFNKGNLSETRLSYPIKKQTQAIFGFLHFRAFPDAVEKIMQSLRLNSGVLRALLVTPPVLKEDRTEKQFLKSAKTDSGDSGSPEKITVKGNILTNEALEEKLEEILK